MKLVKLIEELLAKTAHYKDLAVDYLTNKYGTHKNIVYHGTPNITYLKNINDIDTLKNTVNAKSKYLFVNSKPSVALNYAKNYNGYSDKSGIAVFKLIGKAYTIKNNDIPIAFKSNDDFELFLDTKKKLGFDYVKIPQDGNNIAILNINSISLIDTHKIIN
jgi:hypothetical protein